MIPNSGTSVLRDVRRLFRTGTAVGVPDADLLARFAANGDEAAFELLLVRHGPMVLATCRQLLNDPNDVADAFQATALVLVRKAHFLRIPGTLGPWLHAVACRVATRLRAQGRLRQTREQSLLEHDAPAPVLRADQTELAALLHDALSRLPESLRTPVVLCHLEGLTHAQAAAQLNCPIGTVRSRLARGRQRLRDRLERRGLDASMLEFAPMPQLVPFSLLDATLRVALKCPTPDVSNTVVTLAEGVLAMTTYARWKAASVLFLTASLMTGAVVSAYQAPADPAKPGDDKAQAVLDPLSPQRSRNVQVQAKLSQHVSMQLDDAPVGKILSRLGEVVEVRIVVDPQAMAELQGVATRYVSLSAHDLPLREALAKLLEPLHLTFRIEDDFLLVTKVPLGPTLTKTYYVGDLLGVAAPLRAERPRQVPMDAVIDLITTTVAPGTWTVFDPSGKTTRPRTKPDESGGTITPFHLSVSLVIRHTEEVHKELAERFRQIRRLVFLHHPEQVEEAEAQRSFPAASETDAKLLLEINGPRRVKRNARADYTVRVKNYSKSPAKPFQIQVEIPSSVTLLKTSSVGTYVPDANRFFWRLNDLASNESRSFRLDLIPSGEEPVVLRATAEPPGANGPALARTQFVTNMLHESRGVRVEVSTGHGVLEVGEHATYLLRVWNDGATDVRNLQVSATLSPSIEPVETTLGPTMAAYKVADRQLDFPRIDRIAAGRSVEWQLRVKATKPGVATCRVALSQESEPEPLEAAASFRVAPASKGN